MYQIYTQQRKSWQSHSDPVKGAQSVLSVGCKTSINLWCEPIIGAQSKAVFENVFVKVKFL